MALGVVLALWLGSDALMQSSQRFWWWALGVPALVWFGALFLRGLLYLGQLSVVEGWNEMREAGLTQMMRRGRRSQQVLAVSLQTALRALEADGQAQRASLLAKDGGALRMQVGFRACLGALPALQWDTLISETGAGYRNRSTNPAVQCSELMLTVEVGVQLHGSRASKSSMPVACGRRSRM
ncbi:hypothetical protein [Pseudomonas sp. BN415]|uniref:hypothetical protein n=1 Tax=Pseudomonas sp. BN415 TaxID=2567889 RepID=UPI002453BAA3|nr:hypothetical protein [Pseudomonas sp. BN415]